MLRGLVEAVEDAVADLAAGGGAAEGGGGGGGARANDAARKDGAAGEVATAIGKGGRPIAPRPA